MNTVTCDGMELTASKVICVGRNYVAHVRELGNEIPEDMVVFMKPNSAISKTLGASVEGEALHYEGELVFLVRNNRFEAVGFGIDLTRRELQSSLKAKGLPWERAKAFDGAAVFSDLITLPDNIECLSLRLQVDGVTRQEGGVDTMMYKPHTILAELKKFTTLEDGDLVMTGTPAGVGRIWAGEVFEGTVLAGQAVLVSARWQAQ